jgi:hypothetical protein
MWNSKTGSFARSVMILVIAVSLILVFSTISFAATSVAMPSANHHAQGQAAIAQAAVPSSLFDNPDFDPDNPLLPPPDPMPFGYIWSG